MARRRLSEREQGFHKHTAAEQQWIDSGSWPYGDNFDVSTMLAKWRRFETVKYDTFLKARMAMNKIEQHPDLPTDLHGPMKSVMDFYNVASDVYDMFSQVLPAATTIVAKEQWKTGKTTKPWVYQLPERYRDTEGKRKFTLDNRDEFQPLISLRHSLRNAMKTNRMPHPVDHFVYAILLASTKELAAVLGTNESNVKKIMGTLMQWGYVLDLGVRNEGNVRLGKAWLFGRMLSNGPKQSAPSWLEPPCVVPPTRSYRCECWEDKGSKCAWASPDGDGLHRQVQTAWMCRPNGVTYDR